MKDDSPIPHVMRGVYAAALLLFASAEAAEVFAPASQAARAETTVALEIINNFPVVPVVIEGQTIPVAFDLGGDNQIELTATALERIEVRYLSEPYTWLDAKGNKLEARKFVIPELRIGAAVFRDVEGHEDAESPNWPRVRAGLGRMGRGLFTRSHTLELDYRSGTMRLDATCTGHRIPFDPQWSGEPVSKALTDAGELTFVWDTGAPVSIVQTSLAGRMRGGRTAQGRVITETFSLGGKAFEPLELHPMTFVQPEGADGFIGYDFFARHRVCIDFPGRAFWVSGIT